MAFYNIIIKNRELRETWWVMTLFLIPSGFMITIHGLVNWKLLLFGLTLLILGFLGFNTKEVKD